MLSPAGGVADGAQEIMDLASALSHPVLGDFVGEPDPDSVMLLTGMSRQLIAFLVALLLSEDTALADRAAKMVNDVRHDEPTCACATGGVSIRADRVEFVTLLHDGLQSLPVPLGGIDKLTERLSEWATQSVVLSAQVKSEAGLKNFLETLSYGQRSYS